MSSISFLHFIMFDRAGWHNLYPVYIATDHTDNTIVCTPRGFPRLYEFWTWLTSDVLGIDYLIDSADLEHPFYIRRPHELD